MSAPAAPPGLGAAEVERLFVALERPLYNVVYRWLWDRDEAAELVQEAFARLWQARARVHAEGARAFVTRIAVNLAASRRRWRALRRFVAVDDEQAADATTRPDVAALGAERAEAVRAAVDALPEKLRRVLVLCEVSELSYAEIASALDIPIGTVGSRRHAAAERLRRSLNTQENPREAAARR